MILVILAIMKSLFQNHLRYLHQDQNLSGFFYNRRYSYIRQKNLIRYHEELNFKQVQEQILDEDAAFIGIPVCSGNFESPVIDNSNFIEEIHYQIGSKVYVENAD